MSDEEPAPPDDDEAVEDPPSDEPEAEIEADSPARSLTITIVATAGTTAVIAFAFDPARAGTAAMLIAIGLLYAALAAFAVLRFRRRGELRLLFRPAPGDVALGAATAGLLYGAARIADMVIAGPGTPREAWLMRLYLQLGDPRDPRRELIGGAVFLIAALEEIVWRGLVMRSLRDTLGGPRALLLSSTLFTLAHVPTLFLLRDPRAGLNPLVVAAAFGCSLVWGGMVLRTGRYFPAIFAHALFSWAIFEFPIWRP